MLNKDCFYHYGNYEREGTILCTNKTLRNIRMWNEPYPVKRLNSLLLK